MKLSHLILSPVVLTALTAAGNELSDSTANQLDELVVTGVNPASHKSMADLERTMAHEIVGHKGIHSLPVRSFNKVCGRVSHMIDS